MNMAMVKEYKGKKKQETDYVATAARETSNRPPQAPEIEEAVIGNIAGSAYEGRTHRTKDYGAVKLFSTRAHFTDDTVLTFACAETFLDGKYLVTIDPGTYLEPQGPISVRFK